MRATIKVVCDRQRAGETGDALEKLRNDFFDKGDDDPLSDEESLLIRELLYALRDTERGTPT